MSARTWFAAVIGSIALCCALHAWQTWRECRNHYQFSRAFCAQVFIR